MVYCNQSKSKISDIRKYEIASLVFPDFFFVHKIYQTTDYHLEMFPYTDLVSCLKVSWVVLAIWYSNRKRMGYAIEFNQC